MLSAQKVHFPGLNGLRFIAAAMVMAGHIEWAKKLAGLPNADHISFIGQLGDSGVTLFFVLSGFLITYLLLQEKEQTQNIRISFFYVRRILRIWPLYYLVVFLSFFVLPLFLNLPGHDTIKDSPFFWKQLGVFVFFVPNLSKVLFPSIAFADPLWSVGAEEQFYLLWPHLLKRIKKFYILFFACVALGILVLRKALYLWRDSLPPGNTKHTVEIAAGFMQMLPIECMAIGAIAAVLLKQKSSVLVLLFNPFFQAMMYVVTLLSLSHDYQSHEGFKHLINSVLFAVIITNVAANPKTVIKLNTRFFNYTGNISYGLYVYHFIIIGAAMNIFRFTEQNIIAYNIAVYLFVYLFTGILAGLSYRYFEKKFLALKEKYSIVRSSADKN